MAAAGDQEIWKQRLKSYLQNILESEIDHMDNTFAEFLIENKHEFQNIMRQFLTEDDIQILYSTDGKPNTDINTWTVPLLYVFIVYVSGLLNIPQYLSLLSYVPTCSGDETLLFSLKPDYDGRLQNLVTHFLYEQIKKELLKIIKENNQILTTELTKKMVDIEKMCKQFLTDSDAELLYPSRGSPNTDLNTWNIPLICFVIIRVLSLSLLDTRIFYFLEHSHIWRRESIYSRDKYNGSLSELIRGMERRSLSDVDAETEESILDDEKHKLVLDTAVSVIKEFLVPQPLLEEFRKEKYILYTAIRDMEQAQTTTQTNQEIVQHVRAKGERGYKQFKEFLTNTNQSLLREYLERAENDMDTDHIVERLRKEEAQKRRVKRKDALTAERILHALEQALAVTEGRKLNDKEDIEERLNVQGSTESNRRECCDTIKCVIDQGLAGDQSEYITAAVNEIVVLINVKVSQAEVEDNSSVKITMSCSSSKEMRRLLKTLQGEEFQKRVNSLTEAFEEKYEDRFEVKATLVTEKIQHVHERLRHQGIIEDKEDHRFCKQHDYRQPINEYFCPEHDVLCCCDCGQTTHRTCPGLRQIMSDPVPEKDKDSFGTSFRNTKGEYRMRTDEKSLCTTTGLSVLPNSEIILIDNVNNKLKKLNLEYKVASFCSLSKPPLDTCIVDDDNIIVTFGTYLQFVNVKGKLKPENKLVLPKECIRLAWHDSTIYYTDKRVIYRCDCDGKYQKEVFTFKENMKKIVCNRLAVSNNGKKIYIAAGEEGLMTIDVQNKTGSTLTDGDLNDCTDVCVVVDDNLLICDFGAQVVYLVSSKGDEILRVVAEKSSGLQHPRSLGFDSTDSTMVAGRLGMDFISVFDIKALFFDK